VRENNATVRRVWGNYGVPDGRAAPALVVDVIALITSFAGKLYRRRKGKNLVKVNITAIEVVPAASL
jgi:hypothetical protein